MSYYCYILARSMGFSEQDAETLRDAAPMHDVGKIGIPDRVLLKPGKLDAEEWQIMQRHVEYGVEILGQFSDSKLMKVAIDIAQNHHEKWNGFGYPRGLKGADIPLSARIAAVADVFDALTSERPYKAGWEVERAVNLLVEEKGEHFDPDVVEHFQRNLEEILKIKEQFKDD